MFVRACVRAYAYFIAVAFFFCYMRVCLILFDDFGDFIFMAVVCVCRRENCEMMSSYWFIRVYSSFAFYVPFYKCCTNVQFHSQSPLFNFMQIITNTQQVKLKRLYYRRADDYISWNVICWIGVCMGVCSHRLIYVQCSNNYTRDIKITLHFQVKFTLL